MLTTIITALPDRGDELRRSAETKKSKMPAAKKKIGATEAEHDGSRGSESPKAEEAPTGSLPT
ncbi:MAG: hypothetical protein ACOC2Y_08655 [Spirochaetota bacterium]